MNWPCSWPTQSVRLVVVDGFSRIHGEEHQLLQVLLAGERRCRQMMTADAMRPELFASAYLGGTTASGTDPDYAQRGADGSARTSVIREGFAASG